MDELAVGSETKSSIYVHEGEPTSNQHLVAFTAR
jgi:hypothetical protein